MFSGKDLRTGHIFQWTVPGVNDPVVVLTDAKYDPETHRVSMVVLSRQKLMLADFYLGQRIKIL